MYEGKKKAVEGEFVIQKPSAGGKSHIVTIIVKDSNRKLSDAVRTRSVAGRSESYDDSGSVEKSF